MCALMIAQVIFIHEADSNNKRNNVHKVKDLVRALKSDVEKLEDIVKSGPGKIDPLYY